MQINIAPLRGLMLVLLLGGFNTGVRAQTARACPSDLVGIAKCYSDRDENGAYILAAVPSTWSGVLIVHSHGGPRTSPLAPETNDEDLARFSVFVREGHAWVNSSYRRPGYGARMAVDDTENARRYFIEKISPSAGQPQIVIAHGQSWGGNVAAKLIELDATPPEKQRAYHGALLTSAVLPGGARGYWFRSDLRAVYNYYCRNHPSPDERQYPVAIGLPAGAKLTTKELRERVEACTGVSKPASQRSPAQVAALANITKVIKIEESSLLSHMGWATFLFQDMVQVLLAGRSPFSNTGVTYSGSTDDTALNAGVERFSSEPTALAALNNDSEVQGTFEIPVISMHAINDPTAFVENEQAYQAIVHAAGRSDKLVQVFTNETVHSKLSTPQYPAALNALLAWIRSGKQPSSNSIASGCDALAKNYDEPCQFNIEHVPQSYSSRVPSRQQ